MTRMAVTKAREDLAELVNRAAYRGERFLLERRGKEMAAIIPAEDLALLEMLEDKLDVEAARKALAGMKAKGEKPIAWATVRKDLGL